ncbi:MAG: UDP-glucose/GDP-mannose dehydrogenase family protein [Alphaproteobacteria bacterium]|jgi:UDPglucose 6-dehydrogenase|nr:UDP-glucose/GDP-mannose dehydrogenase family protein [Alphaproteobacteria bacterium]MDP6237903.1 UDP-glucose/GDP-mannose dehydrogenase family protein [Alphaproteobacteria bacterium]MDP7172209.1 UDP-glucose/GDP-mannose dehydrogenase family protein [Alphaproteobacteria bacterium]MDP7486419.1 UDP-glucose/GDP-mannose dehydrogenase family protein [Alphaproteobacteria bacterium]|tara:strand:+ start:11508 stop:12824 length:1317 start_codon:yes stop_codon:yes gene_type:complete
MRIVIVGSGYVGLVSGACFSEFGVDVTCIDSDSKKIKKLKAGGTPIYEPGLDNLVARNVAAGRLAFSTELAPAVDGADVVFIAVGTPSLRGDGHADLSYIYAAAEEIAAALTERTVVVTKSTVPVHTSLEVERVIAKCRPDLQPGKDFDVASNPEFLREGSAIEDFMHPDRVVVGAESEHARTVLGALYRPLYLRETPIVHTARETAELIKYAANAFLATKITFINEIADLCEKVGADVQQVAKGMGLDNRIGPKFLHPGPGYGGSCFPKDTLALVRTAREYGAPTRIVETVVEVNEGRKQAMANKVVAACGGSVGGATIAVFGLSFKPNTDDMRDSPSLNIVPILQAAGASVRAYDPKAMDVAAPMLPGVEFGDSAYDIVDGANALVIVTEWNQFRSLDLQRLKAAMRTPVVVDLRNIYQPAEMAAAGFTYVSIGRP